jgi:hypothetical protein
MIYIYNMYLYAYLYIKYTYTYNTYYTMPLMTISLNQRDILRWYYI